MKEIEVGEAFVYIENKYDLFNWNVKGIYIWEIIRVPLYLQILQILQKDSFTKYKRVKNSRNMLNKVFELLNNLIFYNPFLSFKQEEIIFFDSGRRYKLNGKDEDLYTYFIEESYKESNKKFAKYNVGKTLTDKNKSIQFIFQISCLFGRFLFTRFSLSDQTKITLIEDFIYNSFNAKIDLKKLIADSINNFKIESLLFDFFLFLKRPKQIYLINYLKVASLINLAKKKGIKTIEIQHGLIIEESIVYHFPNVLLDSLKYFPTNFIKWKNFQGNTGVLPLSRSNIIESNYNHFYYFLNLYTNIKKENNFILVASQPMFSNDIFSFVVKNAYLMPEIIFYYKLHPLEFDTFFDDKDLTIFSKLTNVVIVRNEMSVYELLAKCKYTIGIYSTLLFESPYFKSIPLILFSEKSNISKSLINNGYGIEIDSNRPLTYYIYNKL